MTPPFQFKHPFPPPQTQPTTPSTHLSAHNFLLQPRSGTTPSSSTLPTSSGVVDDIDDPASDNDELPRKKTRYSAVHDFSSDEDEDIPPTLSSVVTPPTVKRPPVILPQPAPDSPPVDFSPSRRQHFQPNGLAACMLKIIHEHNALSSVALPHLDREDLVTIEETRAVEGGVGWICAVTTIAGSMTLLLIAPKGHSAPRQVNVGDTLAISNVTKLESIWICTSWRLNTV